jgi:uncharacterized RDD family membrane protein YckC
MNATPITLSPGPLGAPIPLQRRIFALAVDAALLAPTLALFPVGCALLWSGLIAAAPAVLAGEPAGAAVGLATAAAGLLTQLSFFAVVIGYELAFEGLLGGTPGRLLAGTRLVGPDGSRPGAPTVALRAALRALGVMLVLPALAGLRGADPHPAWDRAAGTRVAERPPATPLGAWAPDCDRALVRLAGGLIDLTVTRTVPALLAGVAWKVLGVALDDRGAGGPTVGAAGLDAALPSAAPLGAQFSGGATVVDLAAWLGMLEHPEQALLALAGGAALTLVILALAPAIAGAAIELGFERFGGGTLGRRATGERISTLGGERPGLPRLALRTGLKHLLIGIPPVWLVPLLHPDRRALWDLAAGTRVADAGDARPQAA